MVKTCRQVGIAPGDLIIVRKSWTYLYVKRTLQQLNDCAVADIVKNDWVIAPIDTMLLIIAIAPSSSYFTFKHWFYVLSMGNSGATLGWIASNDF